MKIHSVLVEVIALFIPSFWNGEGLEAVLATEENVTKQPPQQNGSRQLGPTPRAYALKNHYGRNNWQGFFFLLLLMGWMGVHSALMASPERSCGSNLAGENQPHEENRLKEIAKVLLYQTDLGNSATRLYTTILLNYGAWNLSLRDLEILEQLVPSLFVTLQLRHLSGHPVTEKHIASARVLLSETVKRVPLTGGKMQAWFWGWEKPTLSWDPGFYKDDPRNSPIYLGDMLQNNLIAAFHILGDLGTVADLALLDQCVKLYAANDYSRFGYLSEVGPEHHAAVTAQRRLARRAHTGLRPASWTGSQVEFRLIRSSCC